ncbi:VOC family protein [Sphingopyxis sp.]|uniref:VOC family protein n=1 Tax=Sphingopyxis sp. TaxID=1908224 RepID=UPI0035B148E9
MADTPETPRMIFVNLPVTDLEKSKAFYEAVGATNNPAFTDDTAACMVIAEGSIHVMLLTHEKWATFTSKTIPDAHMAAQVLLCVSADSRGEVDGQVGKAVKAGGKADPTPTQDFDFMYGRSFEDPDGHIWEVMWMDPAAIPAGEPAEAAA